MATMRRAGSSLVAWDSEMAVDDLRTEYPFPIEEVFELPNFRPFIQYLFVLDF